jgi:hypothetical protein
MKLQIMAWIAATIVINPLCADDPDDLATIKFKSEVKLGSVIEFVDVSGFTKWYSQLKENQKTPVVYINGHALKGVTINNRDPKAGAYTFFLPRSLLSGGREIWTSIRQQRSTGTGDQQTDFNERRVLVGFGVEAALSRTVEVQEVTLELVPKKWIAGWSVFFIAVLGALWWLAKSSDILKQPSRPGSPLRTYSLARFQMAWWFVVVAMSFVFIWLLTSNMTTINADALILMGISSATYLSSVAMGTGTDHFSGQSTSTRQIVSDRMNSENLDVRAAVRAEKQSVMEAIKTYSADIQAAMAKPAGDDADASDLALLQTDLKQAEKELAELKAIPAGFWREILSDGTGVKLHRFQMLVWTFVFSIVFSIEVIRGLIFPELGATLLGLMGLSSGTYIGFKFPEIRDNE